MTGAEYIAEFLRRKGVRNIFVLTGGACAFIIDAIARNNGLKYTCFQHEQAAAMAADSIWRIGEGVGVTVATSGPGATNLITGIASSYFDSIPSFHITGQVNALENSASLGLNIRQAGFQETKIVEMIKPVTKYAVQINEIKNLKFELANAWNIATSGRFGPVLVDIPMNIQKEEVGEYEETNFEDNENNFNYAEITKKISNFFENCQRPLVLFGSGVGLSGSDSEVVDYLVKNNLPFVSSWNGMTYFNHDLQNYCGNIGVYGNRGANFILQNCDRLLVLGSRLDNRQRSGNSKNFAISAKVMVVDVDHDELQKYKNDNYDIITLNLKYFSKISKDIKTPKSSVSWLDYIKEMKEKYFNKDISEFSKKNKTLSPYLVVQRINNLIDKNAIVVADTGAALCWLFQIFKRSKQTIFTAGGNSPMGYSLPAAIGAALTDKKTRQIISLNGDGGFQLNLQELQTIKHYNLNIKIIIMNNSGYGIIKQFQDLYFNGRHEATGNGYSCPDFKKIANAYDIKYHKVSKIEDLHDDLFNDDKSLILDIFIDDNTPIEPKLELGKAIHNQFPYLSKEEFDKNNRFCDLA